MSYQTEESHFSQEFHYASLGNCLEDGIQWVRCVVFITTFLWHCTLQEHMVNGQCLTTVVTSSRRSLGQDIWGLVAFVWPIRSRVITTSSALVKCWNFFGGPSVGFTRYRYLPRTDTSHLKPWVGIDPRFCHIRHWRSPNAYRNGWRKGVFPHYFSSVFTNDLPVEDTPIFDNKNYSQEISNINITEEKTEKHPCMDWVIYLQSCTILTRVVWKILNVVTNILENLHDLL